MRGSVRLVRPGLGLAGLLVLGGAPCPGAAVEIMGTETVTENVTDGIIATGDSDDVLTIGSGVTVTNVEDEFGTGVTINAVCPGYTDTDLLRRSLDVIEEKSGTSRDQALKHFTGSMPINRLVDPQEVSDLVDWLCCRSTEVILGQSLVVAGGEIM